MEIIGLTFLISYLFGSIPFGWILLKVFKNQDIRASGSGNIGATNATRVGGKLLGFCTLLFDGLKGVTAIITSHYLLLSSAHLAAHHNIHHILAVCGFMAVIGHMYPIWFKGVGGKGVATAFATIVYFQPYIGLIGAACWIIVFYASRMSSLASLTMMIIMMISSIFMSPKYIIILITLLTVLIFIKHISNIKRLINGTESKF